VKNNKAIMTNKNTQKRLENDSLGTVAIDSQHFYGPQTQRALNNFPSGFCSMPRILIKYYAAYKYAAISANLRLNLIEDVKAKAMQAAALTIYDEKLYNEFPLTIWQSGSGTQTNMNLNEVISNYSLHLLGKELGNKNYIHPNDTVNQNQSSNDSFAIAMHLSSYFQTIKLIKTNTSLINTLREKAKVFKKQKRIARTHLQDAVMMPGDFDLETFIHIFKDYKKNINIALKNLLDIPIGGTAIGSGVNVSKNFSIFCQEELGNLLNLPIKITKFKASKIASHDTPVNLSASVSNYASALLKLANDIRWLGCGPKTGLMELNLPENEPGSSIMPGKVNPTLAESLKMACITVMGYHNIILNCNSQGEFQLNVTRPTLIYHLLKGIEILNDNLDKFTQHCLKKISLNEHKIKNNIETSLMQVTKLVPIIGYDKAANLAKFAHINNLTLIKANEIKNYLNPKTLKNLITKD